MDAAKSVVATFTLQAFTLTVSKAGTGTGTVTSSPAGINCGATCAAAYDFNTSVTLTAAAVGSTFTGWSGSGCSGTGTCTVTMDAAKSVTATFSLEAFTLTVSKAGTGSGTVTSSPAGINCGATCAAPYDVNTSVTLTAAAATGSTFTGWSGSGCSGTGTCVVTMDAAKSVTATFTLSGPPGLDYFTVNPCRILDTRSDGGPLISGVPRSLAVAGVCGIPADAMAVAINVTALEPPSTGRITIFPGNGLLPTTSTINFPLGRTLANNAIVALATDATGTLAAQSFLTSGGEIDFAVDIVGYFK
jgi:hypothetical protein